VIVILAGIMICVTGVIAFSSWRLRNWRTVAVLVSGGAAMFAATVLPSPIGAIAVGGMWTGMTLLVATGWEALSSVSDREYEFIRSYVAILTRIKDLQSAVFSMEPADYVAEFEQTIGGFERLDPPSDDWAELRAQTVQELRRRATMMRLGGRPSPETMRRANEEWAAVERRFQRMLNDRKRFWARPPRPPSEA
jgi:hypothetical protein